MFLPAVDIDDLLEHGVISGAVCGCDEHWDRTVGSEDIDRVLALCRPIWNEKEGMEDDGG